MTKAELIDAIATKTDVSKAAAGRMLEAFVETVGAALKKGDTVQIVGFGSFSVAKRAARTGRNPQTGEEIKIKASKAPKFTPGAGLKALVNPKKA